MMDLHGARKGYFRASFCAAETVLYRRDKGIRLCFSWYHRDSYLPDCLDCVETGEILFPVSGTLLVLERLNWN